MKYKFSCGWVSNLRRFSWIPHQLTAHWCWKQDGFICWRWLKFQFGVTRKIKRGQNVSR